MDEKEEKIQRALGLLRTYEGYIKVSGYTHHNIYEVTDTTLSRAHVQLNRIVTQLNKITSSHAVLNMIVDISTGKTTWLAGRHQ